tara:strand:- start:365 stop:619 length:255 start_codon:yes stop_codon:yes gene_type:complete
MAVTVQFRRGTAAQNNSFTGAAGEVSVNTTNNSIRVHDGSTAGGHELMLASVANISGNVPIGNVSGTISASAMDDGSSIDGGTY